MTKFDHQASLDRINELQKKQTFPAILATFLLVGGIVGVTTGGLSFIASPVIAYIFTIVFLAGLAAGFYYLWLQYHIALEQDKDTVATIAEFYQNNPCIIVLYKS